MFKSDGFIAKVTRKLVRRPNVYVFHILLVIAIYAGINLLSLPEETANRIFSLALSMLLVMIFWIVVREGVQAELLRQNVLRLTVRFGVYLFIGFCATALYVYANQPTLSLAFSENIKRISLALFLSAVVIPAVKEVIDYFFDVHSKIILGEYEKQKLFSNFGILHITKNWRDLTRPVGDGLIYQTLANEFIHESSWYVITINPKGLMESFFHETMVNALRHSSQVKWAYLRVPKSSESNQADKLLNDWWITRYDASMGPAAKRIDRVKSTRKHVKNNVELLQNLLDSFVINKTIKPEQFTLYENSIPTTYLAILALRTYKTSETILKSNLLSDIPGLLLVHPYQMWHASDKRMHGMILGNHGELYEQYALSVLRFFTQSKETSYLKKVWPAT